MRLVLMTVGINLLGVVAVLSVAEGVARYLEPKQAQSTVPLPQRDPELGWVPQPNVQGRSESSEFAVDVVTNDLGMYDFKAPANDGKSLSILALGDSHTAATGVSTKETWPKQLQRDFERVGMDVWVHNAGVHGYSLDQYLVRFRKLAPTLQPRVVIIGFSLATDFYDVGITKAGNFVYGNDIGRVYFSLDPEGNLVERRELVGKKLGGDTAPAPSFFSSHYLRMQLGQFALFRLFKQSSLAMWLAARVQVNNESLWPGLDTGLKVDLSPEDKHRVMLAGKLIGQIADEARQVGAIPMLVHIPYLAQVYDAVWESSFGSVPGYDRAGGSAKLEAFARQHGLLYADAYPAMRRYVAEHDGEWVHFKIDWHPTVKGQELIAGAIFPVLKRCLDINPDLKPGLCQ